MGIKDFLKLKSRKSSVERGELEIPPAPPGKEELPTFPSPKEIPEVVEVEEKEDVEVEEIPKKKAFSLLEKKEDVAVRAQQGELDEREELALKKPIFVYLDAYKEMINEITLINSTIKESSDSLARVAEFKEDEDSEFKKWEAQIKDVHRKLTYADKVLFANQR